ncbi:UDP-N-acetylmuramate dehydrogenase [Candidatus Parcubacteria bacterium]|nr:UDP-N-acetylmuramate dehydrogenase [Candidatus Parcubacteria bacterium]
MSSTLESIEMLLKKELPGVRQDVLLKDHTTFQIGGPARYFLEVRKKGMLVKALQTAKKLNLPFFILGGGSNLLVSDEGFKGLVVKIESENGIVLKSETVIEAPAGVQMEHLVDFSLQNHLEGLEWSGGLPGTFGGAIRGNAGAFGGEIKDSILEVEALDKDLNLHVLSNAQCQFSYRSSIFKKENWIVVSATLQCKKGHKENLEKIAQSRIDYRIEKQPLDLPNAGSIFKNCDLKWFSSEWQKELAHVVKQDPFPVVPTAYLISEANLKGTRAGGAEVSKKHPNFIVNIDNAKAADVLELIEIIKAKVKEKYGVMLEQEVQYLE